MELIHLAGTNGKGSTAQYLAAILWQHHSCGLFTSPHIVSPTERFVLNGKQIGLPEYESYMEEAQGGEEHPEVWTLFGVWFKAAMQWFADNNAQYAVIETGLGGRKDQTNVIDSTMQILTPISFDHMQHLGDTLMKIAREKCGIIKWGSTVICHPQPTEVMKVIHQSCDSMDARLIVLDEKAIRMKQADMEGQTFTFRYGDLVLDKVHIQAASPVQVQNACVAAIAAYELGMSPEEIAAGLEHTSIAARVQYCDGVLIDVSHNEASIQELATTVRKYFGKKYVVALTAIMEDKDVAAVAQGICSFADVVLCTCANKKHGLPAKEYVKHFNNAQSMEDPSYAFEYAKEIAHFKKGIVVVCGSFYLVPFVLRQLEH